MRVFLKFKTDVTTATDILLFYFQIFAYMRSNYPKSPKIVKQLKNATMINTKCSHASALHRVVGKQ